IVRAMARTDSGVVWMGAASGLVRVAETNPNSPRQTALLLKSTIKAMLVDGTRVWAANEKGLFEVDGARQLAQSVPGTTDLLDVYTVLSDFRGGLWLCDSERGLFRRWASGSVALFPLPEQVRRRPVFACAADHEGRIWVGFDGGWVAIVNADEIVHVYGP